MGGCPMASNANSIVMFRYNRTITKNVVNKGYFFYFSSNDNKFINRQNFR